MLTNARGSIRMSSAAMARKMMRAGESPPPAGGRQWTLVADHREAYSAGGLVRVKTFPLFARLGVGSFSIASMHRVNNARELEALLSTPEDELPIKARPLQHGFYARWTQASPEAREKMARAAFRREAARVARRQEKETRHGSVPE
jgi:hypothetical protein